MSTTRLSQRKAEERKQQGQEEKGGTGGHASGSGDDSDGGSSGDSSQSDSDSKSEAENQYDEATTESTDESKKQRREKKRKRKKEKKEKEKKKQRKEDRKKAEKEAKEKAQKERQENEEKRKQLKTSPTFSVCEKVDTTNLHTLTRKGSRTDGVTTFNCKVTVPTPKEEPPHHKWIKWVRDFARLIILGNADLVELGPDFEDWAAMKGKYGRQQSSKNMTDACAKKYEATRAEQVKVMKVLVTSLNLGTRLDNCPNREIHIGTGYSKDEEDVSAFRTTLKNMKALIRVAPSLAFYDFGPTIPALRTLAACKARCEDLHKQFKGHDGLVNALLGETSMAEYATVNMELAAPVLHYSSLGYYITSNA
jgi:hypothetical protein